MTTAKVEKRNRKTIAVSGEDAVEIRLCYLRICLRDVCSFVYWQDNWKKLSFGENLGRGAVCDKELIRFGDDLDHVKLSLVGS